MLILANNCRPIALIRKSRRAQTHLAKAIRRVIAVARMLHRDSGNIIYDTIRAAYDSAGCAAGQGTSKLLPPFTRDTGIPKRTLASTRCIITDLAEAIRPDIASG